MVAGGAEDEEVYSTSLSSLPPLELEVTIEEHDIALEQPDVWGGERRGGIDGYRVVRAGDSAIVRGRVYESGGEFYLRDATLWVDFSMEAVRQDLTYWNWITAAGGAGMLGAAFYFLIMMLVKPRKDTPNTF